MTGHPTVTADPARPEAEPNLSPNRRKVGRFLLRASIGVGLIAFLLSRADLASVADSLSEASYGYVALAGVLVLSALVLGGTRWRPYLDRLGFEVSIREAMRLSMIGAFFNAFLPTGIGGDTYRAFMVRRGPGTLSRALASVILDRAAGVIGMATIAMVGLVSQMALAGRTAEMLPAALTSFLIFLTYGILMVVGRRFGGSIPPSAGSGIREQLTVLLRGVAFGAADPRTSLRACATGVLTALLLVGAGLLLARAVHVSVPLGGMAAILLLASVIAIVPLSINGLGFRETVYVWGLAAYGIGHDAALAFALLALGIALTSSALCGLVFAAGGGRSERVEVRRVGR
jgi:uncharacterized membrane protein YbhN (UPF0104 family)